LVIIEMKGYFNPYQLDLDEYSVPVLEERRKRGCFVNRNKKVFIAVAI